MGLFPSSYICWGLVTKMINLEKVPWSAEKRVYSFALGWNVLYIYGEHHTKWGNPDSYIYNLIGPKLQLVSLCPCLVSVFLIEESAVLKSPIIIVLGAMCALSFSKVSFMNEGALAFGATMFRIQVLLGGFFLWPARSVLLCLFWWL